MERDMLYNKPAPNELYHHGIKGQRHGVRNGPPYPLGKSQISASEKKEGSKVSLSARIRDGLETRSHNRKVKKEVKRIEKAEIKKEAAKVAAEQKIERAKIKREAQEKIKAQKEENRERARDIADGIQGKVKRTKNTKRLSDADLATSIERLQKEKQYKDLMTEVYAKDGKGYFKSAMGKAVTSAVADTVATTGKKVGNAVAARIINAAARRVIGEDLIGLDDAKDGIVKKGAKDGAVDVGKSLEDAFSPVVDAMRETSSEVKNARTENKAQNNSESQNRQSGNSKYRVNRDAPKVAGAKYVERVSGEVVGVFNPGHQSSGRSYADQYADTYVDDVIYQPGPTVPRIETNGLYLEDKNR